MIVRVLQSRLARQAWTPLALALALTCAGSASAAAAGAAAAIAAESPVLGAAGTAMWWGDFAALEKQNAELKRPGHLDEDGASQIEFFRTGVNRSLKGHRTEGEAYFKEMDALTLGWAQEHPQSAFAHILHAEALLAHAWSYRGGGFAKDVPPAAWKDFNDYLRRAVAYLGAHADVALTDSHAHLLLLQAGRALGWTQPQLDAIRREGLKRNPEDVGLYFEMLSSVLPRWGGNPRALDDYIKSVVEETRAQYGTGFYARLYASAAESEFGHALFENSHADWPTMKQAYEDMFARYPNSPKRRNNYAYMACLAKDKETLLRLLGEIGKDAIAAQWGPNGERSLEGCRRWAGQL